MIPIRDYVKSKSFPLFNTVFILANLAVFLRQVILPDADAYAFVMEYAFIADRFFASPLVFWHTPFTTLFFHGGFIHFIGNMLFLFVFGDNVEDALGHIRYFFFYFLAGILSLAVQLFMVPELSIPVIGASGAISAVLGAYIVLYPLAKVTALVPVGIFLLSARLPAFLFIGVWAGLQFFSGYLTVSGGTFDMVAYFAHIGGFVYGFFFALIGRRRYLKKFRSRGHVLYRDK